MGNSAACSQEQLSHDRPPELERVKMPGRTRSMGERPRPIQIVSKVTRRLDATRMYEVGWEDHLLQFTYRSVGVGVDESSSRLFSKRSEKGTS